MSGDVVRGTWARDFLVQLRADPSLAWDPETVRCRELMVREDTVGWVTPEVMLEELLQRDEGNRQALKRGLSDDEKREQVLLECSF